MKTNILFKIGLVLVLFWACSTKKDKFLNRNFQALNTKYNVLYNGGLALDAGLVNLKQNYTDNFWKVLPIERLQIKKQEFLPAENETKNADFERAEDKAIKAIQKRSMLINGSEKNYQIDEAHLLLGKARYYDQRFVPALEAFNYILYKYPKSDKIYEAKIWREKTNIRLEYEDVAIENLRKLLSEIKFKDQIFADANAILAQAYLNIEQKDSAISKLKLAKEFTKNDEEKARYTFILGQINELQNKNEEAFALFQEVIDMKRKSPRRYIIQSHARQAAQFDFKNGDTLIFLDKFDKLIKDKENKAFLDVLFHQKALFYDKQKNTKQALTFYNKSLRTNSPDAYLMASNYRNSAEIYFKKAKYKTAGNYYDSTLVYLEERTREFNAIKKKRDNLDDVIKYETIAQKNDSIINVLGLSDKDRISFYEDYIIKLKKEEEKRAEEEKKRAEEKINRDNTTSSGFQDSPEAQNIRQSRAKIDEPSSGVGNTFVGSSNFYFYNKNTLENGKKEFKRIWGARDINSFWRLESGGKKAQNNSDEEKENDENKTKEKEEQKIDPRYTPEFYISQLPKTLKEKDSLTKERNFAYYQLGVIYKEKFKEYQLAADRLEILLRSKPEERLVLPAMYNLYRIYEIIDKSKALAIKEKIITQFPDSRYAQLLKQGLIDAQQNSDNPETVYASLYNEMEKGDYRNLLLKTELAIERFNGEEIIPKLELLKAQLNGKLKGLPDYKAGLNFVALNYPNKDEGKQAEKMLTYIMPRLENLDFNQEKPNSWKIIFKANNLEDKKTKTLIEKVNKFIKERGTQNMTSSIDIYTMTDNFFVIHGLKDEEMAKGVATILKEFKDYKITEPAIVISNENYKVVQIKKCLDNYLNPAYVPLAKKDFPPMPDDEQKQVAKIERPKPAQGVQNREKAVDKMKQREQMMQQDDNNNNSIMMPPSPDMPKRN